MAKAIMIQGTASNSGKTFITAGLCRIFMQDGYKVAPFKSQNMALNSFITEDGLEMGRAQVIQAEACNILPDVRMNPILLKPTNDKASQVIVNGEVKGNMNAYDYFNNKHKFVPDVLKAYNSLAKEYDIIVLEGAGSPAEINLKKGDIVNMGMAELAKAPVLLVGDIDRGGVFASITGTVMLLDENEKDMVKGTIINKFRGDVKILEPGLKMLEDIIKKPVVGVVPSINVQVDDEDSLSERFNKPILNSLLDIAIIRLPYISNFTDFNPFEYMDGVSVRYVTSTKNFGQPDLVIIPGTKSTISDLLWLRESGLESLIIKHANKNKPIFGICGGFQMLGQTISDPYGVEGGGEVQGLGLLSHSTVFEKEKIRKQNTGVLSEIDGIFSKLSCAEYEGYEIHMGKTEIENNIVNNGNVYGTYIHGIFDKDTISKVIAEALLKEKGLDFTDIKALDIKKFKQEQYDILADELRKSLDMKAIYKILEEGI